MGSTELQNSYCWFIFEYKSELAIYNFNSCLSLMNLSVVSSKQISWQWQTTFCFFCTCKTSVPQWASTVDNNVGLSRTCLAGCWAFFLKQIKNPPDSNNFYTVLCQEYIFSKKLSINLCIIDFEIHKNY